MSDDKILSGEHPGGNRSERIIAGETKSGGTGDASPQASTLKGRLAESTRSGGLKKLPPGFEDADGDWKLINSTNPFEQLYLDYTQYKFITPEMVSGNYGILQSFWKENLMIMNTGGNRVAFKNKYGEGTIENSLAKLKRASEKLASPAAIEQYYTEINNARLKAGEERLKDSIEHMVMDGSADRSEIRLCLERGLKYDLLREETAVIIKRTLDEANFRAYGNVEGYALVDQLLSVDHWMTPQRIEEAERLKKERESLRIQILPGKYATSIEQVGNILFDDPKEAREIIREDLLKSVIAQKDVVLARVVAAISKDTKDLDAAYLQILYTLNPQLPFRFQANMLAKTVEELCMMTYENQQTLKIGRDQLTKGYTEIWLKETNKKAYEVLTAIRDTAPNADVALLQFIYTFCPALPYRLAGANLITNVAQLAAEINKNKESWEAGRTELHHGSIPVWLRTTGKGGPIQNWEKIREKYPTQPDVALEEFLHLLDEKLEYGFLKVDRQSIGFPTIQGGRAVYADIVFTNVTRGYVEGVFSYSKIIPGLSLSSGTLAMNTVAGVSSYKLRLTIDTATLLKGVEYHSAIILQTFSGQKIQVPVSFKVVFPTNAFLLEAAKYAGMLAVFFGLTRLLIASEFPGWLQQAFNYFLSWEMAFRHPGEFALFGWTFFLFLAALCSGVYFLTRYLRKHEKG